MKIRLLFLSICLLFACDGYPQVEPIIAATQLKGLGATGEMVAGYDGIWSTIRLNPTYTGPAIQVKRSSDSDTEDIYFLSNGKCDVEAFNTWASGGGTITCTIVYDQVNSLNLTLEATFLEPIVFYDAYENTLIISMERATACSLVNATWSCNSRTISTYTIVRGRKESTSSEVYFNYGTNNLLYYRSLYNQRSIFDNTNRFLAGRQILDTDAFTIHSVRSGTSNVKINVDNRYAENTTAVSNTTATGIRVGRWPGAASLDSKQDFIGWVAYKSVLSDDNDFLNVSVLLRKFNKKVGPTTLVICVGNSIVLGRQPLNERNNRTDQNWMILLKRQYGDNILFVNSGEGGNTVAQINTARAARITDLIRYHGGAFDQVICIVAAGTNEIAAGTSPATIDANLNTLCTNIKAEGVDKVIVCTIIPRNLSAGNETNRNTLNGLIIANTYADGVADVAAAAWDTGTMFAASEGANYIHPNPLGYEIMWPVIKTALDLQL